MQEFLKLYQLDIMMILGCICGLLAFMALITKTLSRQKKRALVITEIASMLLLLFDRQAYLYRGDPSTTGYIMVRLANFMVFFMTLAVEYGFTEYLIALLSIKGESFTGQKRLNICKNILVVGMLLVAISQFTGLYYSFDETNTYRRGPGFVICYAIPFIVLILALGVIAGNRKRIRGKIRISLYLFTIVPILAAVAQYFLYGISLTNISIVGMAVLLYVFFLMDMNAAVDRAHELQIAYLSDQQKSLQRLFDQVATSFVNAIDAKDPRTRGHSLRVARYAAEIAKRAGKEEMWCEQVYYAALLHDVGKLGIPDSILTKQEALTDEEYAVIKSNPMLGQKILSSITEYPYLSMGAMYHSERFDGTGYPHKLKGEQIPEIARIISVADAYDTMISGSSYKEAVAAPIVREELLKGSGSQFDPQFVEILMQMIDTGSETLKRDREQAKVEQPRELICREYRTAISGGISISADGCLVRFKSAPDQAYKEEFCIPSLILFDAYDGKVHSSVKTIKASRYIEYGEIWFDGHFVSTDARDIRLIERTLIENPQAKGSKAASDQQNTKRYRIESVKDQDHIRLILEDGEYQTIFTVALPDSSRSAYLALTGEHCRISEIVIEEKNASIAGQKIERIVDKISYIDQLEGDIKNVQIDGYRTESSESFEVRDNMRIMFHTMSLPTANLVWHCPSVLLFSADDGKLYGKNYIEHGLIRLDGEDGTDNDDAENDLTVIKHDEFLGWEEWKEYNKKGYAVTVSLWKMGNEVILETENMGIDIHNVTSIKGGSETVYAALTGDQCALTNIMIIRAEKR